MPVPLHVHLDAPLPEVVGAGGATAVFVAGWCVSPAGAIASLSVVVDGAPQPVDAHGMPRLDVLRALHPRLDPYATAGLARDEESADDPFLEGYRSGFWATVALDARASGSFVLDLRAELEDGQVAIAPLGTIAVEPLPEPAALPDALVAGPHDEPLVAVCMATYEPREALLRRQISSLQAQTGARWVCVISDDCSSDEGVATLRRVVGDDPRFVVSRSPRRLGFYRNFERALALAPREAPLIALADQDDAWHPDKLATLAAALGDAQLVYSDARVVREDGTELAPTYWGERANNHDDLLSLLVANAVTGAASLFRRELLEDALPFPPAQFAHFHDHWLGLVALARGEIAYVDRPLYDYVQHGEASLGHANATRRVSLRERAAGLRGGAGLRDRVALWRMHFFVDVARLTQVATVLRLRVGDRMAPGKRRALDRFTGADSSLTALARLWARGARDLARARPETLGAEWMLAHAFTWRRALAATAKPRPQRRLRLDAVPPPDLAPKPGRREPEGPARAIADKVAPLTLAVRDDAPARINLLLPAIDLQHLFGGYIAKFNLARRLAERGARVRLVTVDPQPPLAPSWREQLESFAGLEGLLDRVEVAFGREAAGGLEVSRDDTFIATTWWSAHIADAAARALGDRPFLYLVQEYEPFTFPMGTYAALADESYRLPHRALFSTELLREFFRRHGLGVYRAGIEAGDAASASFQNAITAVPPPTAEELAARSTRRLLFYARPEPHAARNMFELGVLALSRAAASGALRGWELHGIGSLGGARRIDLGGGAALDLLPRTGQDEYARTLRGFDVGLALMYTPHPSLVPIEMASAGMLTVTTTFEHKDAAALAAISPNLLGVEAGIGTVADGIAAAAGAVDDVARRAAGSRVAWSQSWDTSLDDALVDRMLALLDGRG